MVRVGDARSQVRGEKNSKRDEGGQKAGGYAGGVFDAWDGDDEIGARGCVRILVLFYYRELYYLQF
jgi:hypothetical protein